MREAIGEGGIEDRLPPVGDMEHAAGIHGEAGRRLHPAIGREDPEGRDCRPERDHAAREEMHRLRHALPAEQHDAEEARLEEEGGQHLVGHQRADDVAAAAGQLAPIGAELVGQHVARDHAHAEGQRKDLQPVLEQVEIDLTPRPQP